MKKTLALLCAIALGSPMMAALKYVEYDLTSKVVTELAQAPEDINGGYFETKMLFVSDGTDYYMGVFEVTEAQAYRLFGTVESQATTAYASGNVNETFSIKADFPDLFIPTVAQWQAYAAGEKVTYANVVGSTCCKFNPERVVDWRPTADAYVANAHGVYDIFGNVAEYTADNGDYYGDCAHSTCRFNALTTEKPTDSTYLDGTSGSFRGVRLVYTPPAAQSYTVSVTVNDNEVYTTTAEPGAAIAYTLTVPEGYELLPTPTSIAPVDLVLTGTTFTMPESNVMIAYTAKKFVTLSIVDGRANTTRALEGEEITLSPTKPEPPYSFTEWALPEGWTGTTTEKNPVLTVPSTITAGSTVTFTANYKSYPRVFVYGGTVEVTEGEALGDGYYTPGTRLLLSYNKVDYYAFKEWVVTGEEESTTSNGSVTVGDYDTVVAYTATYIDSGDTGTIVNPLVTRIGEQETEDGYTTRATFGYQAKGLVAESTTVEGNTFLYYGANRVTGEYALLNLTTDTVSYATTASNSTDNKTSTLVLKRTILDGVTPYYIGIYETTKAHHEYLRELAEGKTRDATLLVSAAPYNDKSTNDAATIFAQLKSRFVAYEVDPQLPTKAQIEGIKKARLLTDDDGKLETYTGSGYWSDRTNYGDTRITEAMIVCKTTGGAIANVGSKTVDPYGFYDLWGNSAERLKDKSGVWGGCYSNALANCNLYQSDTTANIATSYRPAIELLPQVDVTIDGIETPFAVIAGQTLSLQPQVRKNKRFTGWSAQTATGTTVLTVDAEGCYLYTVTEPVTLIPTYEEAAAEITVTYEGCYGPTTLLPGQTTSIYHDVTRKFAGLIAEPASAVIIGDDENGELIITVKAPAVATSVKLIATYADEPVAPGYLFRVQ